MILRESPARQIITSILLVVVVLAAFLILVKLWGKLPDEANHYVPALIVLIIVSLLEHMVLHLRFERWVRDILVQVQDGDKNIETEFDDVTQLVKDHQRLLAPELGRLQQKLVEYRNDVSVAIAQFQDLLMPAASCGLTRIYPNRAAAEKDVMAAIAKAKKVSILGIAFSEAVSMTSLIEELSKKSYDAKFELRILMLDPLRSPAIFRSFFESTTDQVERTIKMGGGRISEEHSYFADHPYFAHPLFNDFLIAYNKLKTHTEFELGIRFYAHNPSCWMLIIDGEAFFQPYTIGSTLSGSNAATDNLRLGAYMPVFRFDKDKDGKAFELLSDHFSKLWLTTDIDMFHMQARLDDKREIVRDIFTRRMDWLKHVYTILHKIGGKESRTAPRQPCRTRPGFTVAWMSDGTESQGAVENFSRQGLGLRLTAGTCPTVGQQLKLSVSPEPKTPGAQFIIERLLKKNDYEFEVRRVNRCSEDSRSRTKNSNGEWIIIGLRASEQTQRSSR